MGVGKETVCVLLDGGADCSIIDWGFFKSVQIDEEISLDNDFLITGASNIPLSVIGRVNICIKFEDCDRFQTFIIA